VDEETEKQLLTGDEGKKYLARPSELDENEESGQKEMSAIATKKFNVA